MKFRKVAAEVATSGDGTAAGQWTSSGGPDSAGCAVVMVKSQRHPPVTNTNEAMVSSDSSGSGEKVVGAEDDTNSPSNRSKDPQREEVVISVTPKAKEIQYNVEERSAPPKAIIEHFYKQAMEQGDDEDDNNETSHSYHQRELASARILSLEDVLLPAIAYQENQALKQIQRKIQRDAPDQTHIVTAGRLAVNNSLGAARLAARQSRADRRVLEDQREDTWARERLVQRDEKRRQRAQEVERLRSEEAKTKAMQKLNEKRAQKKKFAPNQELWREVAYLMTESSKLDRESRLWQEAEAMFDAGETDIEKREAARSHQRELATPTDDVVMEDNDENMEPVSTVCMQPFDKSMEDIIQSSNDIQAALKLVTETMADAEKLRKSLYRRYRQEHQFEGYRGVNDPKGLIRILSQDTEA